MKTLKVIYVCLLIVTLLSSASYGHDAVWPGEKLKILFPEAESFEQKNLFMAEEQRVALEKQLGYKLPEEDLKPSIYLAVVRPLPDAPPKKAAAIIFVDAYGEGGKIEIGVAVNGKGEIMKVYLFENNEPEKVRQSTFLGQFSGKKASDAFTSGQDLTAPPGAEKSAQAVAVAVKRGVSIINEMFRKR